MDKYIYDENNGLWYERCGDYYLPCLTLPEQKSVGKWRQKYRAYLRKHKSEVYNAFQSDGTLEEHVAEIDHQAGGNVRAACGANCHAAGYHGTAKGRRSNDMGQRYESCLQYRGRNCIERFDLLLRYKQAEG